MKQTLLLIVFLVVSSSSFAVSQREGVCTYMSSIAPQVVEYRDQKIPEEKVISSYTDYVKGEPSPDVRSRLLPTIGPFKFVVNSVYSMPKLNSQTARRYMYFKCLEQTSPY